jgi:UDP-glucose 4-epimerase
MKIFISGGAGFIGSHLVNKLMADCRNSVTVYDNFTSGRMEFVKPHLKKHNFRLIKADLLDLKKLKRSLKGHDIIYHLASNPDISKSMSQPDLDLYQGIIATFNVIEAMRVNKVKKIVYVSGSGVYGDVGDKYTAESFGPLKPISMYGASKLSAEGLISSFCHMFDMQAWMFRLANIVGPRQTHGVIFDFIRKLRNDPKALPILGDGTQSKSYLHVSDCLAAIGYCLKSSHETVNIFNVATIDYVTVRDIARVVIDVMGLKAVKFLYTGGDRGWKGDVPVVRLDIKKITRLGWKPKYSSKMAVRRAAEENLSE